MCVCVLTLYWSEKCSCSWCCQNLLSTFKKKPLSSIKEIELEASCFRCGAIALEDRGALEDSGASAEITTDAQALGEGSTLRGLYVGGPLPEILETPLNLDHCPHEEKAGA